MKFFPFLISFLFITPIFSQQLNQTDSLEDLRLKIQEVTLNKGQFTILHIGDSHMQPNNLSGMTRYLLQKELGNAGRGLIFPYTLAKTNGPKDVTFRSNITWDNAWIIKPHTFAIGLTGISIQSKSNQGYIVWKSGSDTLKYPSSQGFLSFQIQNCQDCKIEVNGRKKTYTSSSLVSDTIQFNMSLDSNKIQFSGGTFRLLDLIEKSSNPGILYHSTGVAGATFQTYVENPLFEKELAFFHPDLVIISLGTNESVKKWDEAQFKKHVNAFIYSLKKELPSAKILIVLPNENYLLVNEKWTYNERIDLVRTALTTICLEQDLLIYDQHIAMGGKGSMLEWEKRNLVNKDHIHFLRKGYQEQGKLLYFKLKELLVKQ
jgi:lysophospholipase L1-like esterase